MPDQKFLFDDEFDQFFDDHFTKSAFRLEVLDFYEPDVEQFQRYLRGEDQPDMERKQPWLDYITEQVSAGRSMSRVHIVRSPLNDYLKFACEWGYIYNSQAGEDIRILDLAAKEADKRLIFEDFWLFDDQHVVIMHYDEKGTFIKGEVLPDSDIVRYRAARDAAWMSAEPFTEYWENHPQYWKVRPTT